MRGIAYNRDVSDRKARRKKYLSELWQVTPWYNNLHQYSKNKIHCSCGMCSCKTNQHHEHSAGVGFFCIYRYINEEGIEQTALRTHSYGTSHSGRRKNWKYSDLKRINKIEQKEKEWRNAIDSHDF